VTCDKKFWTSGIQDKSKTLSWCSKKAASDAGSMNWASGQSAVDGCLTLTLSNVTVNDSTFALSDCAAANYFVCEVCAIFATVYIQCERHLIIAESNESI
jgi:hypothetical protein